MSLPITIADLVVATINASGLGVAERWYVPIFDPVKSQGLIQISVVPRAIAGESLTRRSDDFTVSIDMAVQQKMPNDVSSNAQVKAFADPLMLLQEMLVDLFRGNALGDPPFARCMGFEHPYPYDPGHLDENRVFTSIATLHFKADRARL